jgi:fructokinase
VPLNTLGAGDILKKGLSTILQPIVDVLIPVEHSFLTRHQLTPGSYTIVDRERQNELMAATTGKRSISSGGSASNSIASATILGVSCAYHGLVGDDDYGRLFQRDFTSLGIASPNEPISDARTGTCLSLITPDGERTMLTDLGVALDLDESHIDQRTVESSSWLLLEGHLLTAGRKNTSALLKGIEIARAAGTKVALNINSEFAARTHRDLVLSHFLPQIDLLVANEPEAAALTQTNTSEEAFEDLSTRTSIAVVTRGARGALVRHEGRRIEIPAYTDNIAVVDSTGAGDTFTGALLAGLALELSIEAAGRGASRLAAAAVSQAGARLSPSAVELWRAAVG